MSRILRIPANNQAYFDVLYDGINDRFDIRHFLYRYHAVTPPDIYGGGSTSGSTSGGGSSSPGGSSGVAGTGEMVFNFPFNEINSPFIDTVANYALTFSDRGQPNQYQDILTDVGKLNRCAKYFFTQRTPPASGVTNEVFTELPDNPFNTNAFSTTFWIWPGLIYPSPAYRYNTTIFTLSLGLCPTEGTPYGYPGLWSTGFQYMSVGISYATNELGITLRSKLFPLMPDVFLNYPGLTKGTWSFVAIWMDNVSPYTFYVQINNGTIWPIENIWMYDLAIVDKQSLTVGGFNMSNTSNYVVWYLDQLTAWSRLLSETERTWLYYEGAGREL